MFTEARYRKHSSGIHTWELHIQTPHEKYLAMNYIPKTAIQKDIYELQYPDCEKCPLKDYN